FELEQRVDDARLVDLLNRASLMAYAPRLEPLGLAPLEAGACGLPVVAVAEAGVRETVVDGITGSLTGPTVPEFATEMRRLLADPAERAALGGRAVKHVGEQWSLELAVDRLEAVLEEAVIEGRRTENASAI
ncbi:MAG: glycosyltransferase family 4 protein, partial [Candidatus Microthrix parvicella]